MLRVFVSAVALVLCSALGCRQASASQPDYSAVKSAVAALRTDESPKLVAYREKHFGQPACWARSGCEVVEGCTLLDTYLPSGERDVRSANYAVIANVVLMYERRLTKLGYPPAVWRPAVNDFESYEVARAKRLRSPFVTATPSGTDTYDIEDEPFKGLLDRRLMSALQRYQATHPRLRGLVFQGGCGSGETSVKIATAPLATQLFIIPTFFYEVCRAQHVKPDDMNACDHWREVLAPVEEISGSYHYFVRWADGVSRRGILNVNDLPAKDNVSTVTLQKP